MEEQLLVQEFANGITLLGQPMEQVSSAALTFALRAGGSRDPDGREGSASVAAEWLLRGAGQRSSRQLNDALDSLGCQHHESVLSEHLQLSACLLGRNLTEALALYADILQRPRLDDDTFDPCLKLILQDLEALEYEPARKCNQLLREKFFPQPLGRNVYGSARSLEALTAADVRTHVQSHLSPHGAIFAVAGRFDWNALCEKIEALFGAWTGEDLSSSPPVTAAPTAGTTHSRLFTEVREKRGLAYLVQTSHVSLRDHAGIFTYAATRPDSARETFDVTVGELRRLADGVEAEELARAKTQLRSALVMQGQSTAARAGSLLSDWYHLGRLRSLAEVSAAVEAVTREDVREYLQQYPANNFTILTVGPDPMDIPEDGIA